MLQPTWGRGSLSWECHIQSWLVARMLSSVWFHITRCYTVRGHREKNVLPPLLPEICCGGLGLAPPPLVVFRWISALRTLGIFCSMYIFEVSRSILLHILCVRFKPPSFTFQSFSSLEFLWPSGDVCSVPYWMEKNWDAVFIRWWCTYGDETFNSRRRNTSSNLARYADTYFA